MGKKVLLALALVSSVAFGGEALSIRRLPNRQMRVTLTPDSTGGELLAFDGSSSIYWDISPSLCARVSTQPSSPWACIIPCDDRRFKARARGPGFTAGTLTPEEPDVSCVNNGGSGCPSCLYPTRPAGPPAPPRTLTASCTSNSQMPTLSWLAPLAGGQDGFLIEVSSDAGNSWQEHARLSPELLTARVAGAGVNLAAHVNIYYRVRALAAGSATSPSNIVSTTTGTSTAVLPVAPTGLSATYVHGCFEGLDCPCQ